MNNDRTIRILGISGSLRRDSFNTALLHSAKELAPDGVEFEVATLHDIPLYDDDEKQKGFPDVVTSLADRIRKSDAVMFGCPEYNYSVTGVLKNGIDWLSRLEKQPFEKKPVSIVGASMGRLGTARAQYHLRQIMVFVDGLVMTRPEVFVAAAQNIIKDGQINDDTTRDMLAAHVGALVEWIDRVA